MSERLTASRRDRANRTPVLHKNTYTLTQTGKHSDPFVSQYLSLSFAFDRWHTAATWTEWGETRAVHKIVCSEKSQSSFFSCVFRFFPVGCEKCRLTEMEFLCNAPSSDWGESIQMQLGGSHATRLGVCVCMSKGNTTDGRDRWRSQLTTTTLTLTFR